MCRWWPIGVRGRPRFHLVLIPTVLEVEPAGVRNGSSPGPPTDEEHAAAMQGGRRDLLPVWSVGQVVAVGDALEERVLTVGELTSTHRASPTTQIDLRQPSLGRSPRSGDGAWLVTVGCESVFVRPAGRTR
jgi:hypothetical protein